MNGGGHAGGPGGGHGGGHVLAHHPVLDAITHAALRATGAEAAWMVAVDGDSLVVVASEGSGAGGLVGRRVPPGTGTVGFVVASGQPLALAGRPGDPRLSGGVTEMSGLSPASVCCVPCGEGEASGALELLNKTGGGGFTIEDVETVSLLAEVAATALSAAAQESQAPSPAQLGADLAALAGIDPPRYQAVARAVAALIAHG